MTVEEENEEEEAITRECKDCFVMDWSICLLVLSCFFAQEQRRVEEEGGMRMISWFNPNVQTEENREQANKNY